MTIGGFLLLGLAIGVLGVLLRLPPAPTVVVGYIICMTGYSLVKYISHRRIKLNIGGVLHTEGYPVCSSCSYQLDNHESDERQLPTRCPECAHLM